MDFLGKLRGLFGNNQAESRIKVKVDGRNIRYSVPTNFAREAHEIIQLSEYDLTKIDFDKVSLVVDIGAHVGMFSALMRSHYPAAIIHAFEPLSVNVALLERNFKGDASVVVRPYGLAKSEQEATIWLAPYYGQGAASTKRTVDHSGDFEVVRFKPALAEISALGNRIDILKIDTEGHELSLLRALDPMLHRVDAIFLEVHSSLALANILSLLDCRFIPVHFGEGRGNRYKPLFVSRDAVAEKRLSATIAPDIYYD
ncbi:methyltransferase, FkbM family [Enhydrobacter aerosaccus]|uniref:Methyltransferase, FkbM family n=1 Tax=Enhydrobacter aerosaccus TaxID=225324 RepID=A0A1T4KDJ3_9HYPH|nr:FkbM family methyltransferase [Enhydrobacter aerosaccus]SJZ40437.1 methyltransferase, FkbM family [Enhydrobacter aerosaccus]